MAGTPLDVDARPRSDEPDDTDQPWLVVLCGLPGVGKSTVAEFVAERIDARRLRTDVVRKELYDDPQYTDEEIASVYRELFERTETAVKRGESIVLDGTFAERKRRRAVREIAAESEAAFRLLEVVCERSVAEERIADRGEGMSDADVEVYRQFREEFHPIEMYHVAIDNSGSAAATREQVARTFPES
ncbi:AAA family ATPase [Natranaeroarchaeum sulfidigenes]|uniref:Adenylylsulfate kinase or related kinase n=1 Tax=Natranaeroarchaeum sulfidigenes TaxID=2784880 RepID=A0A897MV82_9EURY|nr:AAA family ATPase [Natranaeroarchaeum sulfidigenes]QSG02973.1 Adenylylsulfate kinase or related kinase [Natranaeroarchaeum sulfidigenes]